MIPGGDVFSLTLCINRFGFVSKLECCVTACFVVEGGSGLGASPSIALSSSLFCGGREAAAAVRTLVKVSAKVLAAELTTTSAVFVVRSSALP